MSLGQKFFGASSEGIEGLIERDPELVGDILRAIRDNGYKPVFAEQFSPNGKTVDPEVRTALDLLSRPVENSDSSDPFAAFKKTCGYIREEKVRMQSGFFTMAKTGYVLTAAGDCLLDVLEGGNSLERDIQIRTELLTACKGSARSGGLRLETFAADKAYCPDRVEKIADRLKKDEFLQAQSVQAGMFSIEVLFITRKGKRELDAASSSVPAAPSRPTV